MDILQLRNLCLLSLMLLSQGCTGDAGTEGRSKVFPVTGKVTLSGSPVAGATVTFSPKGNQPVALGRTDDSGTYSLTTYDAKDGAAEGDYTVIITKSSPAESDSTTEGSTPHNANGSVLMKSHKAARGGKKKADDSGSLLPAKYGDRNKTDLAGTVKAEGENNFDFDLKP